MSRPAMRVLQLTTDLRFGGAERVVVNLAEGLRDRGVRCAVAGLMEGPAGPAPTRLMLERAGFEVYCPGIERRTMAWKFVRLREYVLSWKPDLLHCHLFHAHVAGALLRLTGLACPMVWSHHAVDRRRREMLQVFYRLLSPAAQAHAYASEAVRRFQRARAGQRTPERVIHNGIELGPYLSVEPRPGPVIGALGRLAPEKGFDVLIRAFARAYRSEGLVLRIGGDGTARAALEQLVEDEGLRGRVEFAGFVTDVPAFLAGVNAFVVPSRWEAFGLALLEALAAGLPCAASRVGGLPEVGGDLVQWAEPEDMDGLADAMRRLRPRQPDPERVQRQRSAVRAFSREAMTDAYLRLYREALGRAVTPTDEAASGRAQAPILGERR